MSQTKMLYVLLVILLMVSAVGMFAIGMLMEEKASPYKLPHDYEVVSGTYDGLPAEGTGHSVYINESQREYLYRFDTSVSGSEVSFSVICGEDRVPLSSIYRQGDKESVGGAECTWWSYSPGSIVASFAIDQSMTVHRYVVSAGDGTWSFTADLADKESASA